MAHKTITISEEAYNALSREKKGNESFTDVILRMTGIKAKKEGLLQWINSMDANEDLAQAVDDVYRQRSGWKFRS